MSSQPVTVPEASRFASLQALLDGSPWYALLDEQLRAEIAGAMSERTVAAGQTLLQRGEQPRNWFGVRTGLLKWSTTTAGGRGVTFAGMSAGSWFGEGTLLRGLPRPADVIALQPSIVAVMPDEIFKQLFDTEIVFAHFVARQLNERMHWFMEGWGADRELDADGQVRRALAGLFHPWLYPRGQRHISISQEEVANLAGVSRPRCNRALLRLQEAGLVRIEYGGLTVVDLDGLRRAASATP